VLVGLVSTNNVSPKMKYCLALIFIANISNLCTHVCPQNDTGGETRALQVVSYAGSVISLLCLLLSLVIFIIFGYGNNLLFERSD